MRYYRIHLLRHGKTAGNEEGRFIGRTDLPLSEGGKEKLRSLREGYEYPAIQRLYASPLLRCMQTAEILYPGFEPVRIPELQEFDFGDYENKSVGEIAGDPAFLNWIRNGASAPSMEDSRLFEQRVILGFETVLKDMMAKKLTSAAVITHGGVIMTLLAALGLPKREPKLWMTDNGHGYTVGTSAQLWAQGRIVEVFDPLPFENMDNEVAKEYNLIDLEDDSDTSDRSE